MILMRKSLRVFVPMMAVMAALWSIGIDAQSVQPLVQKTDLVYQGAFRVPAGVFGGSSFAYAASGLAFNPARNSLYITGHDWEQQVAEISIPSVRITNALATLSTASVLQPFVDPTEGRGSQVDPANTIKIGGLLVDNGQLLFTQYSFYDADASQVLSHFVSGLDLSVKTDARGPFQVGTIGAGFVSGYMAQIPLDWQSALGGAVLTGNCCIPIISRTSFGPAAFAINPADIGVRNPVPSVPLVYYPAAHPLSAWDGTDPNFNGATAMGGVVFPNGTRTVLFIGRHGAGPFCYGPGTADHALAGTTAPEGIDKYCYDPTNDSKGTHSYPYASYVWAYDANDLAAVRMGTKFAWDVRPYAVWPLPLPFATGSNLIRGVAYDSQTGRVFISQAFGDGERPVIHLFRVQVGASLTLPTAPTNVRIIR